MNIKNKYPKAWADFEEWFRDTYISIFFDYHIGISTNPITFQTLPFEMQLGVYVKYLKEKKSIFVLNIDNLKEDIENGFNRIEQTLAETRPIKNKAT